MKLAPYVIPMRNLRAFLLMLMFATLTSSCGQQESAAPVTPKEEEEAKHHVQLPTMRVSESRVPMSVVFPGVVRALPDHSISVSPMMAGQLTKVFVVPGQRVRKGQLIALLDDQQLQAQLQQATAPQRAALNQVAQAKIALDLAQKNLSRLEALFAKDIVAQKDVIAARSQVELAKAQVEAAQAKVSEAKLAPTTVSTQLAFTKVYTPISGVVAQRFLNVGSSTDPNTPIVHIVDLSQVIVSADMPADSPAEPAVGQTAEITSVAHPDMKHNGRIISVSPIVDAHKNTVAIELLTNNQDGRLKEAQSTIVSISTDSRKAALIPVSALVPGENDPSEQFVYVVHNNELKRQKVVVGQKMGDHIPVTEGLKAGDEIVVSGAYGIPDGSILERGKEGK
jgi:HlyD family secretion protein